MIAIPSPFIYFTNEIAKLHDVHGIISVSTATIGDKVEPNR